MYHIIISYPYELNIQYTCIKFSNFPKHFLRVLTFHQFNSTTNNGSSLIKSVKLHSSVQIRMKSYDNIMILTYGSQDQAKFQLYSTCT